MLFFDKIHLPFYDMVSVEYYLIPYSDLLAIRKRKQIFWNARSATCLNLVEEMAFLYNKDSSVTLVFLSLNNNLVRMYAEIGSEIEHIHDNLGSGDKFFEGLSSGQTDVRFISH
jgi:hypothetical protein